MFHLGLGVEADRERSMHFYEQAAECGQSRALVNWGAHLDTDNASAGELRVADSLYETAFSHGVALGISRIANRCSDSDPMNYDLYLKAAKAGCSYAQYNVGVAHFCGVFGQSLDIDQAIPWLEQAALEGCCEASELLGWHYSTKEHRDVTKSFRWHWLGAEQGNRLSMSAIGYSGSDLPAQCQLTNSEKLTWLKRAANLGDGWAAWRAAMLHRDGVACDRERELAVKYCDIAAHAGIAQAQGQLGLFYWKGEGVKTSHDEAFKWTNLCALQGDAKGILNLGLMYERGIGCQPDTDEAMRLYLQAVEKGELDAMYQIGECYYSG